MIAAYQKSHEGIVEGRSPTRSSRSQCRAVYRRAIETAVIGEYVTGDAK